MGYPEEKLIQVRSKSELRAGMTVVRKACGVCHRDHVEIISGKLPPPAGGWWLCPGCGGDVMWQTIGDCADMFTKDGGCYCDVIATGRLFRLDLGLTNEESTQKSKTLEKVE